MTGVNFGKKLRYSQFSPNFLIAPMMRYALVRGSHFCPTLFAVVVCPSLAICTAPTPHETITVLYRLAFEVLLMIGDGGLVVPDNPG